MDSIQENDEVVVTAPDGAKFAGKVLRAWHGGAVRVVIPRVRDDGVVSDEIIDTVAVEGYEPVASGYVCARVVADAPEKSAKGAKGD